MFFSQMNWFLFLLLLCTAWPVSNLDLWIRLWQSLAELDCEQSSICWIRSHVDPAKVSGISKVHAFYNGVVDSIAKHTVRSFRSMSLMYQRLVTDHASRLTQARQLSFANQTVEEPPSVVQVDVPVYLGLGHTITPFGMEQVWCVHRGFLSTLYDWFLGLEWFEASQDGTWTDISWIELFWGYLADTKMVPPFWFEGKWVMLDEDPAFAFVLPSVVTLFRTWLSALCASVYLKRSGPLSDGRGLFRYLVPVLRARGLWAVLLFLLASFLTSRISLPHLAVCGL